MKVATSRSEVGIRDLKNGLSKYIDRVQAGEEMIALLTSSPPGWSGHPRAAVVIDLFPESRRRET